MLHRAQYDARRRDRVRALIMRSYFGGSSSRSYGDDEEPDEEQASLLGDAAARDRREEGAAEQARVELLDERRADVVGDVVGGLGTGMFNKAKGLVGVAGGEEWKPEWKSTGVSGAPSSRCRVDGVEERAVNLIATQVEARHGRRSGGSEGPGGSATRYGHQRRRLDLHETDR